MSEDSSAYAMYVVRSWMYASALIGSILLTLFKNNYLTTREREEKQKI
jgi:hypothetical protein